MTSGDDSSQPKNQMFVYHYQFLDDLSFVRHPPAFPLFGDMKTERLDQLVSSVRDQFAAAGWDGARLSAFGSQQLCHDSR
jgi:hypothetical protein